MILWEVTKAAVSFTAFMIQANLPTVLIKGAEIGDAVAKVAIPVLEVTNEGLKIVNKGVDLGGRGIMKIV